MPLKDAAKRSAYNKAYKKSYYIKNKEKLIKKTTDYYLKNREKFLVLKRLYNKKHRYTKEQRKKWHADYYKRNKAKVDAKNKKYREEHKEKMSVYAKGYYDKYRSSFSSWKRATEKRRGLTVNITPSEYRSLVGAPCSYCGLDRFIGIDRVDSNIGYTKENSVSCCKYCNYGKYTLSPAEFIEHCARVVEFNKGKEVENE